MLVYPDFFKVAVSSSGNHENNDLKGRLLLATGDMNNNVHTAGALRLVKEQSGEKAGERAERQRCKQPGLFHT
jgi:hypothetical protein